MRTGSGNQRDTSMGVHKVRWAAILTTLAAVACGGKETGPVDDAPDGAAGLVPVAPSCTVICTHVVGTCFPGGVIDGCVTDCERSKRAFASCPQDLDPYLVCVSHTSIECHTDESVIVGCSPERDRLESCVH